MRFILQFSACCALGLLVIVLLLVGLMFVGQFSLIEGLMLSGKPLARLSLALLPDSLWYSLTGLVDAPQNPMVQSFLNLCAAMGQLAVVLGLGFYRLWYWS
ncbi:hypothetical protein [Pseudomonas xionganensis]|uniref:Uncharacterized protein n=1 Tax=Pseudomonas xionganensis TaxID=2654845 RepID=A0A6I4KNY8_9PSED|nr:hypothetical protein [Pseudomonas xionganensis]MVW74359.1 hypothetical protein [Pseudomonas xionganensis]